MTYQGRVKDGVIVLDDETKLAEGTPVRVELLEAGKQEAGSDPVGSLTQTLLKYAGTVRSWPPDMARNHDHYLHGAPKK